MNRTRSLGLALVLALQFGAGVALAEVASEAPVPRLGRERRGLVALALGEEPGVRGVVQVREAVVAEAHALAELAGDRLVADLVVDDA